MSVRINPCFGCPLRKGCEQREEFAKRVRGLGLRSAMFNCAKLDEALKPGTRVIIAQPVLDEDGPYGSVIGREHLTATITSRNGNRFACVIDREDMADYFSGDEIDRFRFRKSMLHSRIVEFSDEPARRVCEAGNVVHPALSEAGDCCEPRMVDGQSKVCHCKETREYMARVSKPHMAVS